MNLGKRIINISQIIYGTIVLLFSGVIYAWSIFIAPIELEFGFSRAEVTLTFSICMIFFSVGGLFAGIFSKKIPKNIFFVVTSIAILFGFIGASRLNTLIELYIFYGVIIGFCSGVLYNLTLSTILRNFPGKEGLISGILLMGFGFGGMVLGILAEFVINLFNWRKAFLIIGILFSMIVFFGVLIIKDIRRDESCDNKLIKEKGVEVGNKTALEMLQSKSFYIIFVWLVLHIATGLTVIGHGSPIAKSVQVDSNIIASVVGLISIFNGIGRVLTGFIFDKIGTKKTLKLIGILFVCASISLLIANTFKSTGFLIIGFILAGYAYGSIAPTQSAIVNKTYGSENYPSNFGIMATNAIIASLIGPYISGITLINYNSYNPTFILMIIFCLIGMIMAFFIKDEKVIELVKYN